MAITVGDARQVEDHEAAALIAFQQMEQVAGMPQPTDVGRRLRIGSGSYVSHPLRRTDHEDETAG